MIEGLKFKAATALRLDPLVSLVVPVLNECEGVELFVRAIDGAIASGWPEQDAPKFEIIFVDDGSTDSTADIIRGMRRTDRRIKLISLSRNYRKECRLPWRPQSQDRLVFPG